MGARPLLMLLRRPPPPRALGVLVAAVCVALETLFAALLIPLVPTHAHALDVLYLLGILVVASVWGLWLGLTTAVASAIAFDYFIIPPPWSFLPVKVEDFTILAVFLLVAVLTCSFAEVTQSLTVEIEARTEADLAAELARLLLRAPDLKTALPTASRRLARTLGLPSASIQIGAVASDGRHNDTLVDLQEISRGLHPAMLAKGGLEPALMALARRASIPVERNISLAGRLPERFEVTVYYVVSEALANITKYAYASTVRVDLLVRGGFIRLSVRDDGVGGADPACGSGLIGLTDRVEALGGMIKITSPPGEGTSLLVEIPIGDADDSP